MGKKSQLVLVLAAVAGLVLFPVVPALADDSTTASGGIQSSDTSVSTEDGQATSSDQAATVPASQPKVQAELDALRAQARETLQKDRQDLRDQKTAELRQKACEARQKAYDNRVANYVKAAQDNLDVFSNIFTKVQAFYTDKKLNVADYVTLVAAAKDKQAAAQQAVDVLQGLDVNIDCTQPDPAQTVATVKQAVANARTALQDYRTSVRDVIVALKGASTAQTPDTGGNE